jgi:hypothetical protein
MGLVVMTGTVIFTIDRDVVLRTVLIVLNSLVMIHVKREVLVSRHLRRIRRHRFKTVDRPSERTNLTRQKILRVVELVGVLQHPLRQRHRRAIGTGTGLSLPAGLDDVRQGPDHLGPLTFCDPFDVSVAVLCAKRVCSMTFGQLTIDLRRTQE